MRKKTKITIDPKYILAGLFVFCIILGIISFRFENKMTPVRSAVSSVIAPMQKGINAIGVKISERMDYATTLKKTVRKNKNCNPRLISCLRKTNYYNRISMNWKTSVNYMIWISNMQAILR